MLIIPAIDLKDGLVVRFVQGRFKKKVYSQDPVGVACLWKELGAKFLHIVDLDGAFTGSPKNIKKLKEIIKSVSIPLEFGGGVRSLKTIEKLLNLGVRRVVLGTKAVENSGFLKKAFFNFKDRIIVGVDTKDERVMVKGWKAGSKYANSLEFCLYLKSLGFKELIYTDILKDGTLSGPNIKGIKKILKSIKIKVIASGGVSNLKDLSRLKKLEKEGLSGVIIGKALYEGRFPLKEALRLS